MSIFGYDFVNKNVWRHCLKIASDGADVTWGGTLLHTIVPETRNAHLPTVVRQTGGTASRWEAEDRSRCLDVTSARRVKHDCRYVGAVAWMARYVRMARRCARTTFLFSSYVYYCTSFIWKKE